MNGTFAVGTGPRDVVYDGTNIWVTNGGGSNVSRLNATTGAAAGGPFAVGSGPWGLAYDGTNIWVANAGSANVSRLNAITGAVAGGPFAVGSIRIKSCTTGRTSG